VIHVNADLTVRVSYKEGWQAPLNVSMVLQAGLFRYFRLLRFIDLILKPAVGRVVLSGFARFSLEMPRLLWACDQSVRP
jgi:hypothetical protein